jgi:hypothetical protein
VTENGLFLTTSAQQRQCLFAVDRYSRTRAFLFSGWTRGEKSFDWIRMGMISSLHGSLIDVVALNLKGFLYSSAPATSPVDSHRRANNTRSPTSGALSRVYALTCRHRLKKRRQKMSWGVKRRHWCHLIGIELLIPFFRKLRSSPKKSTPRSPIIEQCP